jgi:predicted amidohydrolase
MDEGFGMVTQAAREGASLIVTIEGFNESVSPLDARFDGTVAAEPLDGPVLGRFRQIARDHGAHIVAGLYTYRDGRSYNSAVLVGSDGEIAGIYDKVHLSPLEARAFSAGNTFPVFTTAIGEVGMLICWDMQFPEAPREIALAGADIIACPTLGWEHVFGPCRAFENGIPLAVAMYIPNGRNLWEGCDPSCIVDGLGRYLAFGSRTGPGIVSADLDLPHEPPSQYGLKEATGMTSMREVRMTGRRPETYRLSTAARPPVLDRYREDT